MDTQQQERLFIEGKWIDSTGSDFFAVVDPSTEEEVGRVRAGTCGDVDRAVAAARGAFDVGPWATWTPAERGAVLRRAAAGLRAHTEEIAQAITAEMGSPITQSLMAQVPVACDLLDYYGGLHDQITWQERRPTYDAANSDFEIAVVKEPIGVVAAIVPWNGPQILAAMKLGPALLAGCTVVLKPAPEACSNFERFAEAFRDAGLPDGVLNIVPADREVGEYLVTHPGVDKVTFTGSTAAGRRIGALCGELIRPCTLELGGKSAAILLEDVDLDEALPALAVPMMFISGQACNAPTRILAPQHRYDEVVEAVVDAVDAAPFGDPHDPDTFVGPLAAERQRERVEGYIRRGLAEGATAALGGPQRPEGFSRGWYVSKTVFRDVDNAMAIAREEIFGPVYSVIPYRDVDDAVAIANDSTYGLAGSVWTGDPAFGESVAFRLRAGGLGVNSHTLDCAAPFGGFKDSGIGRERGPEALGPFMNVKSVITPR